MPRIVITIGDPAGIGPDVIDQALATASFPAGCEFTVLGDRNAGTPGKPDRQSAAAAMAALDESVVLLKQGDADAVVTGPVSKEALQSLGFPFPGQTEYFAHAFGVDDFGMLLTGKTLTIGLATIHEPLAKVPSLLTVNGIVRTGLLTAGFLKHRGISRPRIAVAGLNPHAGANGAFGDEETRGQFDAVVAMYHDQGLIPLKLLDFDNAVNVTLGLPKPRTSPDHGTAYAIAGKNLADPSSMIAAIRLACELAGKNDA